MYSEDILCSVEIQSRPLDRILPQFAVFFRGSSAEFKKRCGIELESSNLGSSHTCPDRSGCVWIFVQNARG